MFLHQDIHPSTTTKKIELASWRFLSRLEKSKHIFIIITHRKLKETIELFSYDFVLSMEPSKKLFLSLNYLFGITFIP